MAFEDLLRDSFTNPLPMSHYDPAFGEEELLGVQAVRPQIVGTTEIPVGPTGLYGRALAAAGERLGARAAAVGDLVARARGQRIRAREDAALRRVQEQAQAERAARLQQGRLRGNIMAGIGGVAEGVRGVVEDPLFKKWVKGQQEMANLPLLRADLPRTKLGLSYSGNPVPTTGAERALERFSLGDFSVPSYDLGGL